MANSGIGWFGPQIDLSDAPSHVGDFVQLLVFVHRSVPLQVSISLSLSSFRYCNFSGILHCSSFDLCGFLLHLNFLAINASSLRRQYKLSNGGEVIRTDIQVGDDTRARFTVSLWQKQMRSLAMSGDVILLQSENYLDLCYN